MSFSGKWRTKPMPMKWQLQKPNTKPIFICRKIPILNQVFRWPYSRCRQNTKKVPRNLEEKYQIPLWYWYGVPNIWLPIEAIDINNSLPHSFMSSCKHSFSYKIRTSCHYCAIATLWTCEAQTRTNWCNILPMRFQIPYKSTTLTYRRHFDLLNPPRHNITLLALTLHFVSPLLISWRQTYSNLYQCIACLLWFTHNLCGLQSVSNQCSPTLQYRRTGD